MRLLAFAASLRRDSFNRKLIAVAVDVARGAGAEVDHADFHEFDVPLYDGDVQARDGIPPGAEHLARRLGAADGLLISSPEYNFSLPGTIKNTIDWLSRIKPVPLRGKHGFLMAASTGQVGGIRGLWQLRIPLEGLGVLLYPDMYTLPWADKAFDDGGRLKEPERYDRLKQMVEGYLRTAAKLTP